MDILIKLRWQSLSRKYLEGQLHKFRRRKQKTSNLIEKVLQDTCKIIIRI